MSNDNLHGRDVSRRNFMVTTVAAAAGLAIGCSDNPPPRTADKGVAPPVGDGSTPGDLPPASESGNHAPVWKTIPDQVWTVGVAVNLDLAQYCTDVDKDPLTFSLDQALPPGVTLTGSVISGTPTAVFAAKSFVATADDGRA